MVAIQQVSTGAFSGTSSNNPTMGSSITEDHGLVAILAGRGHANLIDLSGQGYTQTPEGVTAAFQLDDCTVWYKNAGAAESTTLLINDAAVTTKWIELDSSLTLNAHASAHDPHTGGGTTTTPTTSPITAAAGAICFAVATEGTDGGWGAHSYTPPAGWTELYDVNNPTDHPTVWVGYKISSGGSEAAAPVCTGAGYWGTQIISFAPIALPPTPGPVPGVYDPDDALLTTLPGAFDVKIRIELNGTGTGEFKIRRDDPDATSDILKQENYVRVRVPQIDDNAVFGFFLEAGDFALLDEAEEGGEIVQFAGRGSLAYWERAIWLAESFLLQWWPAAAEIAFGTPGVNDIGYIHFDAGTYSRYTVSGGHASSPIPFTTGGFGAYYDTRRVYTRTGKPTIALVHLSVGSHSGWYVHPFGPGVTEYKKKNAYAFGPSVLMSNISTNQTPGEVIYAMYGEATAAARPEHPIPLMTIDFTDTTDSNGDPWTVTDALDAISAQLGDDFLSTIGQMLLTGALDVYMDPNLGMHVYNAYGRDLTATSYASGKVLFRRGENIADRVVREYQDPPVGTFAEAVGSEDNAIGRATLASPDRPPREISVRGDTTDTTALEALALAELNSRLLHSDTVAFRVDTPIIGMEADTEGRYLPGPPGSARGNYWVGDLVTLDTGTGVHDFDNDEVRVAAITLEWDGAGNMKVTVEVGSGFGGVPRYGTGTQGATGGGASGVGSLDSMTDTFQVLSEKDQPTGYAGLDENGHVYLAELGALHWKNSVRAAATANVTLATLDAGDTLDGIALAEGDDVLLQYQTDASENGIWTIQAAATAATRRPDFDDDTEVVGAVVMVRQGDTNANTLWRTTNITDPVIDTDDIDWTPLVPGSDTSALFAAVFGYLDHGNTGATETFDTASAGWQKATLDSATVTATFAATGWASGQVVSMVLELVQDSTGGRAIDFPASVLNGATLESELHSAASATTYYAFFTHDGGTNWIGFVLGGGGTVADTSVWKPVMAAAPEIVTSDGLAVWVPLVTTEGEPIMAFVPL